MKLIANTLMNSGVYQKVVFEIALKMLMLLKTEKKIVSKMNWPKWGRNSFDIRRQTDFFVLDNIDFEELLFFLLSSNPSCAPFEWINVNPNRSGYTTSNVNQKFSVTTFCSIDRHVRPVEFLSWFYNRLDYGYYCQL